ncbi:SDR family NAD(P)-dependent oxidoreductase [Propionivibrio sp.]|uniref:SDR family NAD(P)-dependent oxidoreductase n=1 Tax=Propionivibrio sp. TaxID=2212460 RepID=UPI00272EC8EA|nr:SDR family NAD(P)-dependent oxidoreductase [Propionivibrio sp.]
MDLWGCPALVTGAASGLGAETARHLVEAGAKVSLIDIDADGVQKIADEIGAFAIPCDVTDAEASERAIALAREKHGATRVLVHCVGRGHFEPIVGDNGPMRLGDFRKLVDTNLISSYNMLRLAAAEMAALSPTANGERGVILLTASVSAYEGQIGEAAYAASKGGVVSMILPAARELGPQGIRVVGIAPGLFGTQTLFDIEKNLDSRLARQIPFPHRFGDPAEFAMLAIHVMHNVMINGCVMRLDGGYHR